jgi:PAS domain S-box-containing protein
MPQLSSIDSVANLTAIIHAVPTALVMVDETGRIALANAQCEKLFGYRSEELVGEPVELLVPHRFRGNHPALRESFFSAPSARPMGSGRDLFGLRRDGSEFPIEIGLNPIRSSGGMFVLSAIVDITDRKRLEARFRATVDSAPMGMIMVDSAGTMVLVNEETERLFGYERNELLSRKVETLIPERYRPRHPEVRTQYMTSPESRRMGAGRDLFGVRKDGSEFPIEIGLNPVRTDEGSFVLAAVLDLSERKRAQADLLRSNEALEVSNLELQQFAYIASHDLQTPLRSIAGFSEILREELAGALSKESDDYLQRIISNVQRMQTLVQDLLSISRVESRSQPFSSVPLEDTLQQAAQMLESSIADAGAEITSDSLPTVTGDRTQLCQVFQNLIGNALKYRSDETPRVHISARLEKEAWVVSVRDNGIGIGAKHHEKIFEIFHRLHTQEAYPGTGIGLAVCRRIVHRHGGRIWVASEPGQGSTFHFSLPLQQGGMP